MTASPPLCRPARKDDARTLARLIEIAGEGIPTYLWAQQAGPGRSALDVGTERAARDDADFSYRNAVVAEVAGEAAGMVLAYRLPEPGAAAIAALPQVPALLRPLVELEYRVPGSYYVNALAVFPGFRRRGLGAALLEVARRRGQQARCARLSVQVFAENQPAFRLYLRAGYRVFDRRPVEPHPCYPYSTEVLLMTRAAGTD